jgi:hypothetical protein
MSSSKVFSAFVLLHLIQHYVPIYNVYHSLINEFVLSPLYLDVEHASHTIYKHGLEAKKARDPLFDVRYKVEWVVQYAIPSTCKFKSNQRSTARPVAEQEMKTDVSLIIESTADKRTA